MTTKLSCLKVSAAIFILVILFSSNLAIAQTDSTKKEKVKTGWNLGALPVVAFDSDLGFQYGALANLFYYGDGSTYPKYWHSLYLEWSRYTKGSGINTIRFDSDHLIPKVRIFADFSYLTEQALDFFGFNGAEAYYNPAYKTENDSDYISRMYYKHDRKMLKIKTDFQGTIIPKRLYWFAGFEHNNIKIATVNIDKLNKGKSGADTLPHVPLLFDKYVNWGIIPNDIKDGGIANFVKLGAVFDTRDNEANPQKGVWDEVMLLVAPRILGNGNYSYVKLAITHRQYFTLVKDRLSFAYRLSYQPKIGGIMPYYMMPFISSTNITRDGLGGSKTIRGVMRNRVVGEDLAYGNFELRWKYFKTTAFNQNIYLALAPFCDLGMVTKPVKLNTSNVPPGENIKFSDEKLHMGFGVGQYFTMNQNFIVSVNFGWSGSESDGTTGLYIGLNFLF